MKNLFSNYFVVVSSVGVAWPALTEYKCQAWLDLVSGSLRSVRATSRNEVDISKSLSSLSGKVFHKVY